MGLVLLLVLCAGLQTSSGTSSAAWFRSFGFIPARLVSATSWSLIGPFEQMSRTMTYAFVHDGFWHALINIWFLGVFGGPLEQTLGAIRYALMLVFLVVCCALCDLAIRPDSVVPLVGASGLVAGLMGFFLIAYPKSRLITVLPIAVPFPVKIPVYWFMLIWLSAQSTVLFEDSVIDRRTAWWIHLAGFILGCLYGLVSTKPLFNKRVKTQKGYR